VDADSRSGASRISYAGRLTADNEALEGLGNNASRGSSPGCYQGVPGATDGTPGLFFLVGSSWN